jgi:hypothetical protein
MVHPQRFHDAFAELGNAGVIRLHVTPEFYTGYTRWIAREIMKQEDWTGRENPIKVQGTYLASDEDIIDKRLGDSFTFRGIQVRLAKEFR